jgi:hypothetical protein
VLDLIYGDYTFVNPSLAKHYGMPAVSAGKTLGPRGRRRRVWARRPAADGRVPHRELSRIANQPGEARQLGGAPVLGEVIPPPPPVVPELPSDEAKSDLPIREKLAQHRANPVCAACHAKFDSFGLAFEGYGPIGDVRTKDLAGRPVDAMATFPGGSQGSGFQGIQAYIREHRQNEYLENLSRKLLAYALNRSLQLSTNPRSSACKPNWRPTATVSMRWWKPSSPARNF